MPQPPLCQQKKNQASEETKHIQTSLKARKMPSDAEVSLKETLDSIVQEFTLKIAELSHLTTNLPKRLHVVDSSNNHQTTPQASQHSHTQHELAEIEAIEEAAENANTQLNSKLQEEQAKDNMPGLVAAAGLATSIEASFSKNVVAFETRVHNAVVRLDSAVADSCCTKLSKKLCPTCIRNVSAAAKKEHDTLRDHLKKGKTKFSNRFDMVIGLLILANCFSMAVQLEYVGYQSQISLGERQADGSWNNAEMYFMIVEHIFNALFIAELFIRYAMDGCKIFCDGGILLDMFLVSGSSVQIYILDPLDMDGIPGLNLSLFRMLRFVKFIKIFRLVRVLKLFSHLRILVMTIASSFSALVWSMLLLLVIMIMSGMFLSGILEGFITNPDNDIVLRRWVFKHYGTASRAVYTLFEVTLAGCWPTYLRPLIDKVSAWYIVFAVGYISVVVFAIMRIITAIFLKETLTIAGNDAEMMLQERVKQKEVYIAKLKSVFEAVDASGDGSLSLEEFSQIVENPLVKVWLQLLEMEVHDANALFRLLDNGDGAITYEEFLKGVMRLKGQARSTDIVAVMHSTDKTLGLVTCIMEEILQVLLKVDPSYNPEDGLVSLAPHVSKDGRNVSRSKSWL